jgi:hypothetical protein
VVPRDISLHRHNGGGSSGFSDMFNTGDPVMTAIGSVDGATRRPPHDDRFLPQLPPRLLRTPPAYLDALNGRVSSRVVTTTPLVIPTAVCSWQLASARHA